MGPTPQPPLIHAQETRNRFAPAGLLCVAASQLVLLLFLSVLERRELPAAVITALYALLPLIPGLLLTGVVLSLKGLRQASRQKGKGRFQALIGLLLGSYLLLIEVFMLAFFTAWGMGIIRK